MKLVAKFDEHKNERLLLSESLLSAYSFQLLPGAVYPLGMFEKTIAWQEHFQDSIDNRPFFSVVMYVGSDSKTKIKEGIESVAVQSYRHFELITVIANNSSHIEFVSELYKSFDLRGSIVSSEEQVKKSTLAMILPYTKGEYLLFFDDKAMLDPRALYCIGKRLKKRNSDLVFCNNVFSSAKNRKKVQAFFRREPLDVLGPMTYDPVGPYIVVSRALAESSINDSPSVAFPYLMQGWYFAMKALGENRPTEFIRLALIYAEEIADKLNNYSSENWDMLTGLAIRYLAGRGITLKSLKPYEEGGRVCLRPGLRRTFGMVQVVIPFHNQAELTCKALGSLKAQTCFEDILVTLVNNNSDPFEVTVIDKFLKKEALEEKVTIVPDFGYFNYARLNNVGVKSSKSPYILLMNNDVELVNEKTIEEMRKWCALKEVGAVGGILRYPDGKLQHAGIVFASVRPANVQQQDQFGYLVREVNAVTFAMALLKREAFEAVGGLDEFHCPNGFGDALFCHELKRHGYRTIFTPFAEGIHYESKSRGQISEELELFEMDEAGLTIADLHADFRANFQPTLLRIGASGESPFMRLARKVNTMPKVGRIVNATARLFFKAVGKAV